MKVSKTAATIMAFTGAVVSSFGLKCLGVYDALDGLSKNGETILEPDGSVLDPREGGVKLAFNNPFKKKA